MVTGADGDDVIAIRSVCYLPLTYDHRLVDGADAGRFVSAIKARSRRARSRPTSVGLVEAARRPDSRARAGPERITACASSSPVRPA